MNRLMKNALLGTVIAAIALSSLPAEAAKRHHRRDALAAGLAGAAIGTIIGGVLAQPRPQRVYIDPPAPVYVRPSYGPPVVYYQPAPAHPRPAQGYDPAPAYRVVEYYRPAPVYRPAPIYRPAPGYRLVEYYRPAPVYRRPAPIYRPAPAYRVVRYAQRTPFYGRPAPAYRGLTPWTREWYHACRSRYRSFDPRSGTFLGYDGHRHFCRVG